MVVEDTISQPTKLARFRVGVQLRYSESMDQEIARLEKKRGRVLKQQGDIQAMISRPDFVQKVAIDVQEKHK